MLYGENSDPSTPERRVSISIDGGLNVWVRSSTNKPAVSATGGPGGGGMLTFNRAQSQLLDGGARTFNIVRT